VKPNKRNEKQQDAKYRYFDEELYKRRTKIEHANASMAFITMFARKLKV
jgi:hypothetical protein